MKEGYKGHPPREQDACSDHTRERKSQPRCDQRKLWRNRSWSRPKSKPFHPPKISQLPQAKTGSTTEHLQQPKPSSSSSIFVCVGSQHDTTQHNT